MSCFPNAFLRDLCRRNVCRRVFRAGKGAWLSTLGLVLCVLSADCALAQQVYELTVTPSLGTSYPPGQWIPLRVELRNNTDTAVDGVVQIPVTLPQAATELRIPAFVPARSKLTLNAYGYLSEKPLPQVNAPQGTGVIPVAMADWLTADGARLARAEVLAQPDTSGKSPAEATPLPGGLLLSVRSRDNSESRGAFAVKPLSEFLSGKVSYPISAAEAEPASLPRHPAGYAAARAVILNGISPDALEVSQRSSLLQYLLQGGILVLPAPIAAADPTGGWLEPYMPVRIIGQREADGIFAMQPAPGSGMKQDEYPVKLLEPLELCEAIHAAGEVLYRDANYVHVAVKAVGKGRVVFTSFPINALDHADPRTEAMWREILDLNLVSRDWSGSELARQRDNLLETMIGAPAAPWSHAALIAGGYVALMLIIQLLLNGARRPTAFAMGGGLAIVICGALIVMAAFRRSGDQSISAARLATIDLGEAGGGARREAFAFYGRDDAKFSLIADQSASLRPAVASPDDPAALNQLPFAAPSAGVRSGRVDRVWEAASSVAEDMVIHATAQFISSGVKIEVDNKIGQELLAPLVVWNRHGYRLSSLPAGRTTLTLGAKNPAGDFTHVSVIAGEEAGLRGRILLASLSMSDAGMITQPPMIAGWMGSDAGGLGAPMVSFATPPDSMRAQVLLRAPLRIVPSVPGETIRIPAEFVALSGDAARGVFYDPQRHEWVQSLQTGAWNIGFQPPKQAGRLAPSQATVQVDLSAPGHKVTLRRGQCRDGKVGDHPEGPVVAEWSQATGSREVSVDLDGNDFDDNGCVWFRLSVEDAGDASGGVLAQWKLNHFSVGLTARVNSDK